MVMEAELRKPLAVTKRPARTLPYLGRLSIRLQRFLGHYVFSSLTRRILFLNLAALCVFVPYGVVLWKVGLVMGACNVVGAYAGARTAVARGAGFVRGFFIVVVTAFVLRIGGGLVGLW